MINPRFHHCYCEMCEWPNFGTLFKFPCIVRIYAWFFMHCRNHHSDSHANHVIMMYNVLWDLLEHFHRKASSMISFASLLALHIWQLFVYVYIYIKYKLYVSYVENKIFDFGWFYLYYVKVIRNHQESKQVGRKHCLLLVMGCWCQYSSVLLFVVITLLIFLIVLW